MAAREILIRFKTAALDRAKKTADDIARKVKEAAKGIKDVQARKAFRAEARDAAKARRADIAGQTQRLDFEKRASALGTRNSGDLSGAVRKAGNQGKEALERANSIFNVASSANLAGAMTLLGRVPVLGQVAAVAGSVVAIVMPLLQREIDAKITAAVNASELRQRRAFFEADVAKRFREDPDFRDRETRRAVREEIQGAAAREGRWRRRGQFTVPE